MSPSSRKPDYVHPVFAGMSEKEVREVLSYAGVCAKRLGCPPDLVEDAVQETSLLLMTRKSFGSLKDSTALRTLRIHWAAADAVQRVRAKTISSYSEPDYEPAPCPGDALAQLTGDEEAWRLWNSLGAREQAIVSRLMGGEGQKEIGESLGLRLHVVNETLRRLRVRIKEGTR